MPKIRPTAMHVLNRGFHKMPSEYLRWRESHSVWSEDLQQDAVLHGHAGRKAHASRRVIIKEGQVLHVSDRHSGGVLRVHLEGPLEGCWKLLRKKKKGHVDVIHREKAYENMGIVTGRTEIFSVEA